MSNTLEENMEPCGIPELAFDETFSIATHIVRSVRKLYINLDK